MESELILDFGLEMKIGQMVQMATFIRLYDASPREGPRERERSGVESPKHKDSKGQSTLNLQKNVYVTMLGDNKGQALGECVL